MRRNGTGPPLRWRKAAILVHALILLLALACQSPQERLEQALTEVRETGEPVLGAARETLQPEEVQDLVYAYLALNVWAENANTIALEKPGQFRKVMFSIPHLDCVIEYREEKIRDPQASYQPLLDCAMGKTIAQETRGWERMENREKEARARKAVNLLMSSIDPAHFMSVNIAFSRRLDVNQENNPDFAEFAGRYDRCHLQAEQLVTDLTLKREPREMATAWINAQDRAHACFNRVTSEIFGFATREDADLP